MSSRTSKVLLALALFLALPAPHAWAHWCDDMWHSAYNIVIRPDSDTSPKNLYVQNNMGYQLPKFILTATSSSGGAVTLTAPTTLKVANTLLPGEKGIWKISAGSPAKIEDLTFSVKFGDDAANWTDQDSCYPLADTKPVMVIKTDGSLFPAKPTGLDPAKAPGKPCVAIVALGRTLQYPAIADFDDVNVGLDKLLQYYCSGRGSWGVDDNISKANCRDTSSTQCPTNKPTGVGSVSDYVHLWAPGELAIRRSSLGARLPVLRERLKCGSNDGDMGFSGYALFVLGYLGDDAEAKKFLQGKATAGGDTGAIAKAALYMMGDTAQKADVQAGLKSSSTFVKVACAGALGIVDKDDDAVTSTLMPAVQWQNPNLTTEDGRGMYAAHILELVAWDRRGWGPKGGGTGPVTFYGETATGGASGNSGTATSTGGLAGSTGTSSGGATSSGGRSTVSPGGNLGGTSATSNGGVSSSSVRSSGGASVVMSSAPPASGGVSSVASVGGGGQVASSSGPPTSSGPIASGGSSAGGSPASQGGSSSSDNSPSSDAVTAESGNGCSCNLGGRASGSALLFLGMAGLALLLLKRRRR
jgi:MYXO-CTERM domain-containing protein